MSSKDCPFDDIFCRIFNTMIEIKMYICEKNREESMMRQILLYVFILFVCNVSAEQFFIKGKVVDNHNEPLIGASVIVKGTNRGTATDIDGNFGILVEKGQTLKFSYVGYYNKEVEIVEILNDSSFVILEETKTGEIVTEIVPYRRAKNVDVIEPDSLKTNPKNQNSMMNH